DPMSKMNGGISREGWFPLWYPMDAFFYRLKPLLDNDFKEVATHLKYSIPGVKYLQTLMSESKPQSLIPLVLVPRTTDGILLRMPVTTPEEYSSKLATRTESRNVVKKVVECRITADGFKLWL